ncbi:12233_t:CDS:2, partial [Entrophospora sp. SA101]
SVSTLEICDLKNWTIENFEEIKEIIKDCIPLIRWIDINGPGFKNKVLPFERLFDKQTFFEILEILKLKHIRIISSWIDKKDQYFYNNTKNLPFTFKLLFSTTRDGFSIRKFHRLCDDKGSTLTITRLNNDHQIIGGYNPVNWKPFDELKTFDKKDIIIARVHDSNNAIFYNSQTGPGFGSGPDLYIKNNLLISFHSSTYPDIEKITNSSQAYEIEKYE